MIRYQNFLVLLSCSVVSVDIFLLNWMLHFEVAVSCLFNFIISVYPYFNSCLTNALTFFWRGGGWGICTLLTSDNVPGVGHLNRKNDLSSNPPPMPGLRPPSSLTLIGALYLAICVVSCTLAISSI